MDRTLRYVLVILCFGTIVVQTFVLWLWFTSDVIATLARVFTDLYGFVPFWTSVVIGARYFLIFLPIAFSVSLIYGLYSKVSQFRLTFITGVSAISTAGILYAMYPIHLMINVDI